MKVRIRFTRIGFLALLLASALECSAPLTLSQGVTSDDIYGYWRWLRSYAGGPSVNVSGENRDTAAGCGCERILILNPNGLYEFFDIDSTRQARSHGSFGVHIVAGSGPADSWLGFDNGLRSGGYPEQRTFAFLGRDTLRLRHAEEGGFAIVDGGMDLFVRDPLGRPPEYGQPYDSAPVPMTKIQPQRSEFAREANLTGTVLLHVLVDESGRVQRVNVIRRVTGLDDSAVRAAREWVFKPALRGNVPVAAWYEIPFEFR